MNTQYNHLSYITQNIYKWIHLYIQIQHHTTTFTKVQVNAIFSVHWSLPVVEAAVFWPKEARWNGLICCLNLESEQRVWQWQIEWCRPLNTLNLFSTFPLPEQLFSPLGKPNTGGMSAHLWPWVSHMPAVCSIPLQLQHYGHGSWGMQRPCGVVSNTTLWSLIPARKGSYSWHGEVNWQVSITTTQAAATMLGGKSSRRDLDDSFGRTPDEDLTGVDLLEQAGRRQKPFQRREMLMMKTC